MTYTFLGHQDVAVVSFLQAALADLLSHPQSAALPETVDLPLRKEKNSGTLGRRLEVL